MDEEYLDDLLGLFIGKSGSTRRYYRSIIKKFLEYIDKPLDDVTVSDVRRYLAYCESKRKYSIGTLKTVAKVLHRLFYLLGRGDEFRDLVKEVPPPKDKYDTYIPEELWPRFLDSFDDPNFRVAAEFMLRTGARIGEVVDLKKEDVDWRSGTVLLRGKGGREKKHRVVFVDKDMLRMMREVSRGNKTYVFRRGSPSSWRVGFWRAVKNAGKKIGFGDRLRPHALRHSFATVFLKRGGNIEVLRRLLGHAKLSTTQIYLSYSQEELRREYERVMGG